jgi:hypothetical protein
VKFDIIIIIINRLYYFLGTFVQVDEDLLEATTPRITNSKQSAETNEKDSGDETGDETDDEGCVSNAKIINYHTLTEKQALAVQMLSNNNTSNSSSSSDIPKFQKVETNKSIPLLSLSHHHHSKQKQSSSSSHHDPPHVIILLGSVGSAIRLTLLPLSFTFSSITPKSTLQSYISSLHYIGAQYNQWDVNMSTHLVALEKKANAKAITAWACGDKHSVTLGYVDALLGRTKLMDGLPKEEDYP